MTYKLKTLPLLDVVNNLQIMKVLYSLTLRGDSNMRWRLSNVKRGIVKPKWIKRYKIILAYVNDKIVGWSMLYPTSKMTGEKSGEGRYRFRETTKWGAYFYVAYKWRKLGIGKALYNKATKLLKSFDVSRWDDGSTNFFDKMETKKIKRIKKAA